MINNTSCRLVIDTSVVCSASKTDNKESSACRKFLEAVLEICHRVVLTDYIYIEWNNHCSFYSRAWWTAMESRDKSFKEALAKTPEGPQIIKSIIWIDPVTDGIEILQRL